MIKCYRGKVRKMPARRRPKSQRGPHSACILVRTMVLGNGIGPREAHEISFLRKYRYPTRDAFSESAMSASVVVGAQFGDEGKGKIIDFLSDKADVVARFQGGANAAHTAQGGANWSAFPLFPPGAFRNRPVTVSGTASSLHPRQS